MKLHANKALIPVVVLLLGGLAFALEVNHFTQEQTALRITQIERARAKEEAARHSEQQAHVRSLQARVIAAQQVARVARGERMDPGSMHLRDPLLTATV